MVIRLATGVHGKKVFLKLLVFLKRVCGKVYLVQTELAWRKFSFWRVWCSGQIFRPDR